MTSLPGSEVGAFASLADDLQEITEALAAASTEREVIEIVLTPAVQALGAVAGIVLLVDQTDQQLKIAGSQGYENATPTVWQAGQLEDHVLIADILRMREARYFEYAGALKEAYPELERRTEGLAAIAHATVPMFLDNRPLGVIVLDFTEPHHFPPEERRFLTILAGQCTIALGRAQATGTLEARVEDRTRQLEEQTRRLEEERAAQAAFVAFTEAVGSETDLSTLVGQAITVLQGRFPGASIGYYEEEGKLWKARVWSQDMHPELVTVISAGVPSETPLISEVLQTRQPVFTDAWDAQQQGVEESREYGASAGYPLVVNGAVHRLLSIGLRHTRRWSEADKALLRSVGRSLNLALERTDAARQLLLQNAELQAHTRALESFAELTRDLALTTDPLLLIRRAQEVVMSMLADGAALYFVLEGERWHSRVQHGSLHAPQLQAAVDAGLLYSETYSLRIPWTAGQPYFQDMYNQDGDGLTSAVAHINAVAYLPLRMEGAQTGVLTFALFNQRSWSRVDRVVLETVIQSLELALDRAAKTRRLDEERTALAAFTHFAERVGSETDVEALVGQAIAMLHETCEVEAAYFERDGDLFRTTVWSPSGDPTLLPLLHQGFPLQHSGIALGLQQNTAAYIDHWRDTGLLIPQSGIYQAVAGYPYFVDGTLESVLMIGSQTSPTWDERSKGIFRAVGHSLNLALDRARQTRMVTVQRDLLNARTRSLSAANEELEAFAYSVSHDLRTPVRHMTSFGHMLRKTLDDRLDEKSVRYLGIIDQAAMRMNTLIDAMLDLARTSRQPLSFQQVELDGLVRTVRVSLEPDVGERQIVWVIGPLPRVLGDAGLLQQVVENLLSNALKYTARKAEAQIEIWAEDGPHDWRVCVRDNGVGFDARYAHKLFGVFQRLHRQEDFEGTGVGLANVRRVIARHGGTVSAEGELDQGATFSFTLPKEGMLGGQLDFKGAQPAGDADRGMSGEEGHRDSL
ncbi:GAF domain-containing protein [Deinococcus sp. Arct2-2]|uniref:GAF domain-containing protein n=1 Tax=Deinococcus sp. Arct2-2 TaxID=2568653 RepID=UPI0010A48BE0|nr:GAF domain-containing protein [Deinococcus sp. Arct2-2]THF70800.1 GAF domain-containing protein [Deinococcus sp. Arct2-2]